MLLLLLTLPQIAALQSSDMSVYKIALCQLLASDVPGRMGHVMPIDLQSSTNCRKRSTR